VLPPARRIPSSVLPLLKLDAILELEKRVSQKARLHRRNESLIASDFGYGEPVLIANHVLPRYNPDHPFAGGSRDVG
jgi:hypothetical protein